MLKKGAKTEISVTCNRERLLARATANSQVSIGHARGESEVLRQGAIDAKGPRSGVFDDDAGGLVDSAKHTSCRKGECHDQVKRKCGLATWEARPV